MIVKVAENIVSPLGFTALDNYNAVKGGRSAICLYEGLWNIPEPFCASLTDRRVLNAECAEYNIGSAYTDFEKCVLLSASKAIESCDIDPSSEKVLFILSTTKGNVALLDSNRGNGFNENRVLLGVTAQVILDFFKNPNKPLVVSNACISGVCAQISAMRVLELGKYDYVVVIGADEQSPFIVSGFQSFKALSGNKCKPFDRDRSGLNLGEAAATIVYARKDVSKLCCNDWIAVSGAIRNDANHISGPSRTAEGSYLALMSVLNNGKKVLASHNVCKDNVMDINDLAFVNVHGTATLYNDEMESIAIDRAGLLDVPVNGLKGFYGHTMGAAGVLESIISMCALDDNTILATKGFENIGVSNAVNISSCNRTTYKSSFIKLLSGFGGCNAALLFKKWR